MWRERRSRELRVGEGSGTKNETPRRLVTRGFAARATSIITMKMRACSQAKIKGLFTLAWPTVLSYFFYHLISMITLFFTGRVGEVELAAGTLAISFINVTGPSIYIGLASALET